MNEGGAKRWLVVSALVVAGVWGYRRWREGAQAVTELPKFFTAWGTTYFILALIGEAAPRFGGAFSILVMTADILSQGKPLLDDITAQQTGKPAAGGSTTAPAASVPGGAPRPASPGPTLPPGTPPRIPAPTRTQPPPLIPGGSIF